jgi:DNA polymerase-3 subunit delta'
MNPEKLLIKQVEENRVSSSYIFYGSDSKNLYDQVIRFSQRLNVSKFSIIEIGPESKEKNSRDEIRVGNVRELIRRVNLTASVGENKLAIIRDADKLNLEASNSLLKTLEEPPKSLTIVLLSNNLKLLPTIISRCQIIKFPDNTVKNENDLFLKFADRKKKMKTVFAELDKLSGSVDLDDYLESILADLRCQLLQNPSPETLFKIKKIFQARNDLVATTNKKLVLENLYLAVS